MCLSPMYSHGALHQNEIFTRNPINRLIFFFITVPVLVTQSRSNPLAKSKLDIQIAVLITSVLTLLNGQYKSELLIRLPLLCLLVSVLTFDQGKGEPTQTLVICRMIAALPTRNQCTGCFPQHSISEHVILFYFSFFQLFFTIK